jgi:DNA polymerase III delta prime subunit
MSTISDYWTPFVNMFDPLLPLAGDPWEACYVEREDSPVPILTLALQPGRVMRPILLAGARGTGKTSALIRLGRSLGQAYTVIWIDLHRSMDVYRFSILDLLLALGGGAYKVALQAGLAPDSAPWQEIVTALDTLIGQVRHQPEYKIPADALLSDMVCARADPATPLPLEEGIKTRRFSLELTVDEFRQLQAGSVLREMVSRVNAIFADVEAKSERKILIIADGLDKIEPALAEDVFEYAAVLTELRGRAVYTVPYGFYKSTGQLREDFEVEELPNVRLHPYGEPDSRYEPGFATLREVARQRIMFAGGDLADVIHQEALDLLIASSGGVLRGFIKLVKQAVLRAEWCDRKMVTLEDAEWSAQDDRKRRSAVLSPNEKKYLLHFQQTGAWEDTTRFLTQVHRGNILAYAEEGRVWHALHPNLLPLLDEFREESNV